MPAFARARIAELKVEHAPGFTHDEFRLGQDFCGQQDMRGQRLRVLRHLLGIERPDLRGQPRRIVFRARNHLCRVARTILTGDTYSSVSGWTLFTYSRTIPGTLSPAAARASTRPGSTGSIHRPRTSISSSADRINAVCFPVGNDLQRRGKRRCRLRSPFGGRRYSQSGPSTLQSRDLAAGHRAGLRCVGSGRT